MLRPLLREVVPRMAQEATLIDTGSYGFTDHRLLQLIAKHPDELVRQLATDLLNARAVRRTWQDRYNEVKKCQSKDSLSD